MRLALVLALPAILAAATPIMPLKDVKAGQRGIGRTVFRGDNPEEFDVEILGVLENTGPRQSLILARLSGGPLAETGVLQGMSGSPVYVNGKLIGAVALGYPYSKQPIAGIRPIEEMLAADIGQRLRAALSPFDTDWLERLPRPAAVDAGSSRLVEVATPVSFGGFTRGTLERFAPQLEALGWTPRQGQAAGTAPAGASTRPLAAGDMISVQLMTGDMTTGADGTVTLVEGDRVYAFGHRFLASGTTDLPFARASVLALLPSLNTSFKISASREWAGVITEDRTAAIAGRNGKRPARMVPLTIECGRDRYRMEMVHDRVLSPMLVQMAMYSAIDSRERGVGPLRVRVEGEVRFQGQPPVKVDNVYGGDFAVGLQAALGVAVPLAYAMTLPLDELPLESVSIKLTPEESTPRWQIDQIWSPARRVRAGDTIPVHVEMVSGKQRVTRTVRYRVPESAAAGTLQIGASDGAAINLQDYAQSQPALSGGAQMVAYLQGLKRVGTLYIRVMRAEASYVVSGGELMNPPPSVALLLSKSAGLTAGARPTKLAEFEIREDAPVGGSKTMQVEIRE